MSIYGKGVMSGGRKPTPLYVSTNGTWSRDGGYSPVHVNVPASAVTSGTVVITADEISATKADTPSWQEWNNLLTEGGLTLIFKVFLLVRK